MHKTADSNVRTTCNGHHLAHSLLIALQCCQLAVQSKPRSVLGLSARHGLQLGQQADFTLFELADAALQVTDSQGAQLPLRRVFEPRMTIIGASVETARRRSP